MNIAVPMDIAVPIVTHVVQGQLGDDDEQDERLVAQNAEVCTLLARLGDAGITQPKQVMSFFAVELHPLVGLYVPVELWL